TEIALEFEKEIEISDMRNEIAQLSLGNIEVKTFGNSNGILVRTELQEVPAAIFPNVVKAINKSIEKHIPGLQKTEVSRTENSVVYQVSDNETVKNVIAQLAKDGFQATPLSYEDTNTQLTVHVGIADWIEENLIEKHPDNPFKVLKEDQVGPKIGNELKRDAVVAVAFALLVILIYLGFRFKFVFSIGAVITLFHDVMITLGMFSLLYGLIPGLNLEISSAVVAAFLALVGYSINDTVVVFDRVRENMKLHKTEELMKNINDAINKTMRRTIITSVTTLITVTVLLIFGGDVLRGFAFTLFFGILIGTYSSIFVSSSFVYEYSTRSKKRIEF
ncbi:MAG: protein translocase subunit SecF, partial [Rhodothermaceae bacterium]